jgi:hypothetical protein
MYRIWNDLDDIPFTNREFSTRFEAEQFTKRKLRMYKKQGYYLTSSYERMPCEALTIGDDLESCFIIYESNQAYAVGE